MARKIDPPVIKEPLLTQLIVATSIAGETLDRWVEFINGKAYWKKDAL